MLPRMECHIEGEVISERFLSGRGCLLEIMDPGRGYSREGTSSGRKCHLDIEWDTTRKGIPPGIGYLQEGYTTRERILSERGCHWV